MLNKLCAVIVMVISGLAEVPAQTVDLKIRIEGLRNDRGVVLVGLYNSERTFLKEKWRVAKIKADTGDVVCELKALPPGEYAVAIVHDENGNDKFDATWFGFPKEGFGFSNDARGFMGPPSFERAKFTLKSTLDKNLVAQQTLAVKYY